MGCVQRQQCEKLVNRHCDNRGRVSAASASGMARWNADVSKAPFYETTAERVRK